MDTITEIIWVATGVVAFFIVLYFWWLCVKSACRDLARYCDGTLREIDTERAHNQGGEDD